MNSNAFNTTTYNQTQLCVLAGPAGPAAVVAVAETTVRGGTEPGPWWTSAAATSTLCCSPPTRKSTPGESVVLLYAIYKDKPPESLRLLRFLSFAFAPLVLLVKVKQQQQRLLLLENPQYVCCTRAPIKKRRFATHGCHTNANKKIEGKRRGKDGYVSRILCVHVSLSHIHIYLRQATKKVKMWVQCCFAWCILCHSNASSRCRASQHQTEPNQTKPNEPNQTKLNRAKANGTEPNRTETKRRKWNRTEPTEPNLTEL
jgi:hypothetical protein